MTESAPSLPHETDTRPEFPADISWVEFEEVGGSSRWFRWTFPPLVFLAGAVWIAVIIVLAVR